MTNSDSDVGLAVEKTPVNWWRILFLITGIVLFGIVYYSPLWPDAVDPLGEHFILTKDVKGVRAGVRLASTWG